MDYTKIDINKKFIKDKKKMLHLTPLLSQNHISLKDQHFSKFYNNIFQKISKTNNLKMFSLTENSLSTLNRNNIQLKNSIENESENDIIINKRKFKDPRNINYKLLKYNPYITHLKSKKNTNDMKMNNLNENININAIKNNRAINTDTLNKDINMITFYNIKFLKNKKVKNKEYDIDKERKKKINKENINILNNILNKKECIDIINKIKLYNDKDKKRRIKYKKYYENNVREGLFGQKDIIGVPYVYDNCVIYKNEYANKSEKNRHEIMLNEINKLKSYLTRHPDKKLYLIKDFLCKFRIDDIEKYNDKQFLNLCDFITNSNNTTLSNSLKPYLNIKNMVYDILNNSVDINNFCTEENNLKQNNSNDYINNNDYQEIMNINNYTSRGNFLARTFYNETPKKSMINEHQYYLSPLISRKQSTNLSSSLRTKRKNFNNKSEILDLDSTNSKLKYMIYQKKSFFPSKTYSNNNIIVNEIGKEIRDMENDYNKKIKELEIKNSENKKNNNFNISKRKSLNFEIKDKLYIHIKNNNNTRLKTFVPIHYKFTKNFKGNMKNLNDIKNNANEILKSDNNIYREKCLSLDGVCLNTISDIKEREEKLSKKKKEKQKSVKVRTKILKTEADAIKRLYYIPTRKRFGLQEIKNRLKLTEYIALTHAKNSIYRNAIKQLINMKK